MKAVVRPPGESFGRALSTLRPRPAIDAARARQQHVAYCAALRSAGLELVELPADERFPDGCFVQDTAVVWGSTAILARFGAESREGEQAAVEAALRAWDPLQPRPALRLSRIQPPGSLEGGDVLVVGSRLWVGLSARTNRAGLSQLRQVLELEGATVQSLAVPEGLHLLSGVTYLGRGVLLAAEAYADLPAFAGLEVIRVPHPEAAAANALGVNGAVILPAGFPRTASLIRERGFEVMPVDLSEFAKTDGGATCLSLVAPTSPP